MTHEQLADCLRAVAHFIDTKEGVVHPTILARYYALRDLLESMTVA